MVRLTTVAALCGVLCVPALVAEAAPHTDEIYGYRIVPPPGWEQLPIKTSEKWIVARFRSKRAYEATDAIGGVGGVRADLRVIVLPHIKDDDQEDDKKKLAALEDAESVDDLVEVFDFVAPFKDYKDYVKRTYSGGGWFISYEKARKRKKLEWDHIEIKVEKLARQGKKRLITGVFHGSDADYAVQYEVTEGSYKKLRKVAYQSLKSFRLIPRTEPESEVADVSERKTEEELTPEEIAKRREARIRRKYEQAVAKLPKGWDHFEYKKYFYVLSHVDRKYAVQACRHGETIWKWAEKHLGWLGEGYVRPIVVRICQNDDELMAYHTTTSSGGWLSFFFSSNSEVVLSKAGGGGFFGNGYGPFGTLGERVLSNYLRDRDRELYWELPEWFTFGLGGLVGTAVVSKRGRLEFPPSEGERYGVGEAIRKGKLRTVRELLTAAGEPPDYGHGETIHLMRFLLVGPGQRVKKLKKFLPQYAEAVREVGERERKKREKEGDVTFVADEGSGPETEEEEEEEEEFRKRRQQESGEWEKRQKAHLETVFKAAFSSWSKRHWDQLEAMYEAYARKR